MAVKRVGVDTDITIADELQFEILTPDADGCLNNPYKVDKVVIYFVARDFVSNEQFSEFTQEWVNPELETELAAAKAAACASATPENLAEVQRLQTLLNDSITSSQFFYKEARPVAVFGTEEDPAWLDPDSVPISEKEQVEQDNILYLDEDEDENEIEATFLLDWNPVGQREGDYFICWTWTPLIAGDSIAAHTMFSIGGATQLTTVIPTHMTDPVKYETLQERYLPKMFKSMLCEGDLTPVVMQELNRSVAKGFTFVEDLANASIDLIDSNATHESILPLLGNMFNVRLKSGDPTLWRRQIKRSIPNYKQKGTHQGLEHALDEAGMTLTKFTRLWQVVSKYTFQEHFDVDDEDNLDFTLSQLALLPVDTDNFELYYRAADDDDWTELVSPTDYVTLTNSSDETTMTWIGDQLSVNAVVLGEGDSIRVVYEVTDVPDASEQTLENYIRALPLADQRDERSQEYPPKNWNVRLIEEDDALFDILIPVRHPFAHPIVWGHVRTEFPYSENIYNMEEYNGSTRPSKNPCDIDKDWLDSCSECQSSKYTVDIEIEELSNDRIVEAQQVLDEFTPFHAVMHSINFSGAINEFVKSPIETITALVQMSGEEIVIAGNAQYIFNRVIPQTTALSIVKRNMLASLSLVGSGNATGSNTNIVVYSPGTTSAANLLTDDDGVFLDFSTIPVDLTTIGNATPTDNSNLLEVISPGPNAGQYTVTAIDGHMATVSPTAQVPAITEPINTGQFTFQISNKKLEETVDFIQDDLFVFDDKDVNFANLGTRSQWDVDNLPGYTGGAWQIAVTTSGYSTYDILNVLPNGTLVILDDGTLPTTDQTGLAWQLLDDTATVVTSGTSGVLDVTRRARVDFDPSLSSTIDDLRNIIDIGDYMLYSSTWYEIDSFVSGETHQVYIDDWTAGDTAGVTALVYRRLAENKVGQLGYLGMEIDVAPTIDEDFENDMVKENYLFLIGSDYYSIDEIDSGTSYISGPIQSWTTSGTSVSYSLYQYEKNTLSIPEREEPPVPGHDFDYEDDPPAGLGGHVDRSGSEIISLDIDTATPMMFYASVLNQANSGNEIVDMVGQEEAISFIIEYQDGTTEEGEV